MFNASAYKLKLIEAINKLGKTNGHKYPESPNDAIDAALVEFVIAKQLQDTAEVRYKHARKAINALCKLDSKSVVETGIAHSSRIGVITYTTLNNPTRLDADMLVSTLVKEFEITIEDAQALLNRCKTQSTGLQVRVTAALNNLE